MASAAAEMTQRLTGTPEQKAQQRAENRRRFPTAAWLMDEMRKHGVNATLQHAVENGSEYGVDPEKDPNYVTLPYFKSFEPPKE